MRTWVVDCEAAAVAVFEAALPVTGVTSRNVDRAGALTDP